MKKSPSASSPAEFWNGMTPAERLVFIQSTEKKSGEKIGHSNSKQTYGKVTNKTLLNAIKESITTSVFHEAVTGATASTSKDLSVSERITDCIIGVLGVHPNEVVPTAKIIADLGADSLDAVEIIMALENEFDISIPDETVEKLHTVDQITSYILSATGKTEAPKEEAKAPEISKELDLVISFDDTGSMYSVRQQVRTNVNSLVDRLFTDIPGLRVGIIIHNDYCDMPRHCFVLDFTTDKAKIKTFVNQNSPCGGGDAPECYELALHEASKMSWKSDRRALVMIGDEVPHEVGYRYGSHRNELDWRTETNALKAMDVKVYGVQALGRRSSNSFYENISRITGGIKLDLSQFQHISTYINAIAYHQAGQLETYETSDPSFNTNLALKNMFNRLKGGAGTISADKIELLSKFQVMKVTDVMKISDFVEANGCTFQRGKGYYQLIERTADGKANSEIIQANKEVLFVNKETGETISDTNWCREQLGVPYGVKATVRPLSLPAVMNKYEIFIQSNSYNRNLDPGTKFLYELEAR